MLWRTMKPTISIFNLYGKKNHINFGLLEKDWKLLALRAFFKSKHALLKANSLIIKHLNNDKRHFNFERSCQNCPFFTKSTTPTALCTMLKTPCRDARLQLNQKSHVAL